MNSKTVFQVFSFFLYILAQGIVFYNIVLFDTAFCFIYVAFILCLPVSTGIVVLLLLGFLTGLSVDIFYDSLGMHAAAGVFISFMRNYWLNMITPRGGYEIGDTPTVSMDGWKWFVGYSFPLLFLHHTFLFFIEASTFNLFWFTLTKALMSAVFSTIFILIFQYLFYRKRKY